MRKNIKNTFVLIGLAALYLFSSAAHGAANRNIDTSTLKFKGGSFKATLQAPSLAANYTLTLPDTDGAANQVLKTDGSGVLDWTTPSGGGSGFTPTNSTSITSTGAGDFTVDADMVGEKIGVFVLAAGGGSGVGQPSCAGAGGGGGTWVYREIYATPGQKFKYHVGAGGAAALSASPGSPGLPGENSYFGPIIALGGSGGNGYGTGGTVRGNGSGQTCDQAATGFSYTSAVTTNIGLPTGNGFYSGGAQGGSNGSAGGSAGSCNNGAAGTATTGGNGGDGCIFTDPITASDTAYGGGGGGGIYENIGTPGTGGAGGGGVGTKVGEGSGWAGGAGTANTGGGAGGGVDDNGAAGGSGKIIVYWAE